MLLFKNTGQLLLGTVLGLTIGLTLSQVIDGDFLSRTSFLTGQVTTSDCDADVDCSRGCYRDDAGACSGTCTVTGEPCRDFDAGEGFMHCGGCGGVYCNQETNACQSL